MKALAYIMLAGLTLWLGKTQTTTANPQRGRLTALAPRSQCRCTKVVFFPLGRRWSVHI